MAGLLIPELLARLAKPVQRLGPIAEEGGKDAGAIGRFYLQSRDLNPEYFATGTELPRGLDMDAAAKFLNKKHGLTDPQALSVRGNPDFGMAGIRSGTRTELSSAGPWKDWLDPDYGNEGIYRLLKQPFAKRAGLSGNTNTWLVDAMGSEAGAKNASSFYPAAYDYVLSQPDAAKLTIGLSNRNATRHGNAMTQTMEKYPELADGRILASPDQLVAQVGGNQRWDKVAKFHNQPMEQQIGQLNAGNATRVADEVGDTGRRVLDASRGYPDSWTGKLANDYLKRFKALGIDVEAPYRPTTDGVNPEDLKELADAMWKSSRQLGFATPTTGYNSLRRAALTTDAAEGLTPRDLGTRPDTGLEAWTTRLGRARGGPVPGQESAGPLCQCHAALR